MGREGRMYPTLGEFGGPIYDRLMKQQQAQSECPKEGSGVGDVCCWQRARTYSNLNSKLCT